MFRTFLRAFSVAYNYSFDQLGAKISMRRLYLLDYCGGEALGL